MPLISFVFSSWIINEYYKNLKNLKLNHSSLVGIKILRPLSNVLGLGDTKAKLLGDNNYIRF